MLCHRVSATDLLRTADPSATGCRVVVSQDRWRTCSPAAREKVLHWKLHELYPRSYLRLPKKTATSRRLVTPTLGKRPLPTNEDSALFEQSPTGVAKVWHSVQHYIRRKFIYVQFIAYPHVMYAILFMFYTINEENTTPIWFRDSKEERNIH